MKNEQGIPKTVLLRKARAVIIVSILVFSSFVVGTRFTAANPSASQTAIGGQWQEENACTEKFFLAGSTYYAQNGDTGKIDFSGSSFSTVVNGETAVMASGSVLCFLPGTTYSQTAQITVPVSATFIGYGATIKWTGATPAVNTGAFIVTADSLNIAWYGGTLDGNKVAKLAMLGFGTQNFGNDVAHKLASETLVDIKIINGQDATVYSNDVSNTDISVRNLFVQKPTTGSTGDTVEFDGTRVNVQMTIDDASIAGLSAITSAFLHDSVWDIKVVNSAGTSGTADIALQSFTNTAVSSPYFLNDVIDSDGGAVELVNGNVATGVVAGNDITIRGQTGNWAEVGTNGGGASSGGERWQHIVLTGTWRPTGNSFLFASYDDLTLLTMLVDCSQVTWTGANALFFLTSSAGNMDRPNDNLQVVGLTVANLTSTMTSNLFYGFGLSGNNMVNNMQMTGGSLKFGDTFTNLFNNPGIVLKTTFILMGVYGVNPIGKISTPFYGSGVGYLGLVSGSAGPTASTAYVWNGAPGYITSSGGTGVSITVADGHANNIVSAQSTLTTFYMSPGWTINFGAFSVAPTVTVFQG